MVCISQPSSSFKLNMSMGMYCTTERVTSVSSFTFSMWLLTVLKKDWSFGPCKFYPSPWLKRDVKKVSQEITVPVSLLSYRPRL